MPARVQARWRSRETATNVVGRSRRCCGHRPLTPPRRASALRRRGLRRQSVDLRRRRRGRRGSPRPPAGAAHDVAGGEHAVEAGHHACDGRSCSVPQRVTASSGCAEQRRQVLGVEAERLDRRDRPSTREVAAVDRLRAPGGRSQSGRPRRIRTRAHAGRPGASPRKASGAESQTNSTPSSSALLHLAHASPACWRGRGDRGTSPISRPGARRCARSPSRCRRRRSRRRACPRASSAPAVELRHRVAEALAVGGDQIVERRHDAVRGRRPGRRCSRAL